MTGARSAPWSSFCRAWTRRGHLSCRKGPGCEVLPADRNSPPTPHARGAGSGARYWVLQSPSLLWATFTFFSISCSSDSATRTSFGFWYCRWSQDEDKIQSLLPILSPLPLSHTRTCAHTQGPF